MPPLPTRLSKLAFKPKYFSVGSSRVIRRRKNMSEDPLAALEIYAANPNPETIPRDAIIHWDDKTITVNDAYPKSWIHCLILPRPRPGLTMDDLRDLRTLLKGDKARAKQVLEELGVEAKRLVAQCEETMLKRCGCKWPIWVGFHALPSMRYVGRMQVFSL